jgi:hypothetical protein
MLGAASFMQGRNITLLQIHVSQWCDQVQSWRGWAAGTSGKKMREF